MPKVTAFAAEIWADGTTDYGVLVASEQVLFADKWRKRHESQWNDNLVKA